MLIDEQPKLHPNYKSYGNPDDWRYAINVSYIFHLRHKKSQRLALMPTLHSLRALSKCEITPSFQIPTRFPILLAPLSRNFWRLSICLRKFFYEWPHLWFRQTTIQLLKDAKYSQTLDSAKSHTLDLRTFRTKQAFMNSTKFRTSPSLRRIERLAICTVNVCIHDDDDVCLTLIDEVCEVYAINELRTFYPCIDVWGWRNQKVPVTLPYLNRLRMFDGMLRVALFLAFGIQRTG